MLFRSNCSTGGLITNAATETWCRNSLRLMQCNREHVYCPVKPKSRQQEHIKERKGKKKLLQFHTSLVSAQDRGDTDATMSQMQCWGKGKSCLWDGNRGVGERVSETAWKIQKNLLSIDGPSLSVRGWTSLELECKEMRFAGWKYYLGEEKTNRLFQKRCKDQTEMYNMTWRRFRLGYFRGNDRLKVALCTDL